jgi:hypothetical protein
MIVINAFKVTVVIITYIFLLVIIVDCFIGIYKAYTVISVVISRIDFIDVLIDSLSTMCYVFVDFVIILVAIWIIIFVCVVVIVIVVIAVRIFVFIAVVIVIVVFAWDVQTVDVVFFCDV